LVGLFERHIDHLPVAQHYGSLANLYHEYNSKRPDWQQIFGVTEALAAVLALKADLGLRLLKYYQAKDSKKLAQIAAEELPLLVERVETLRQRHMKQWLYAYKPFGWEVIDQRYGGLIARLHSTGERLEEYLSGQVASLPELEETRLVYRSTSEQLLLEEIRHHKIISACNR
jgi:hexosaminidase